MDLREIIKKLIDKQSLTADECKVAMRSIMSGKVSNILISALLVALRAKGETPVEIASLASVMRDFTENIKPRVKGALTDTCGTGGDKLKTFNVSTAAMFVLAGAGIPIAKHGNRAVSSKTGSADVLEALGVKIDLAPKQVEKCIEKVGVGFMFAPIFHKAMKFVMPIRKELGIRTVFNILGPLTNPANAQNQILGVFKPELTNQLAEVLKLLGVNHAMVIHGMDGLDEISIIGETKISELRNGGIKTYYIKPEDYGIKRATAKDITGGDAVYNSNLIKEILDFSKKDSAARDIVLLNAAAGMIVAGKAKSFKKGLKLAKESINSGEAQKKLCALIVFSRQQSHIG